MAISAYKRALELSQQITTRQGCCEKCLGKKERLFQIYVDRHANLFEKQYQKWKQALLESENKVVQHGKNYIEYLYRLQENGQKLDDLNVLAAFCDSHETGNTPEPWIMERLYSVFRQYLNDGIQGGDAKIDKFFDLKKTDFNGIKRHMDNQYNESLGSYAMLQYLFDMNHDNTSAIIGLWYGDKRKTNVITQQFLREYQPFIDPHWKYRMDNEMTITARATIFLEKLKTDHIKVFEKLKKWKTKMKTSNSEHPSFK